uniref:Uncharacterized protein n=1 Tax=Romanomermis culicivorax TaxID=13658 RepID=A0A915JLX8_ROMCU
QKLLFSKPVVDFLGEKSNKGGGGGANHDNTVSSGYLSGYHHYASRDMDEMSSTWTRDETSNNLQHISEREPDDILDGKKSEFYPSNA